MQGTEQQARFADRVAVCGKAVHGSPAEVLAEAATHADVVVAGARRRDGERHGVHLGTVTQALLRHAERPVIVVPHR